MLNPSLNRGVQKCPLKLLPLLLVLISGLFVRGLSLAWAEASAETTEERILELKARMLKSGSDQASARALATALFDQGRREEAVRVVKAASALAVDASERTKTQSLQRVLARTFQKTDTHKFYQAGVNALGQGRLAVSEERFSAALTLEPGHFDVLVRRGQVRWLQDNVDGAYEDWSQAKMIFGAEPEHLLWLGISQLKRGERRQGLAQIQEGMNLSSMDQKRRPFWRAAQLLAYWEGVRPSWASSPILQAMMSAGETPSWLLEEWMARASTERAALGAIRGAIKRRPEGVLDTDGPSGISLQVWQPERVRARWPEWAGEPLELAPSPIKPRG